MKKRIFAVLCICITLCMVLTAYADGTNSADISSYGEGIEYYDVSEAGDGDATAEAEDSADENKSDDEDGTETVTDQTITFISGEIYYDSDTGMYCYPLGDTGTAVSVSVFEGMIVTDKVVVEIPENENVQIFRNGNEYEMEDNSISDTGSYVINYTKNSTVTQLMSFMIVYKETGKIENYRMPDNFAVNEIIKDGEEINLTRTEVDFTEEGLYTVTYQCVPTGVEYELNVTIDHTPPTLKLEAVVDGSANGPVDISDLEDDARIIIKRNGKKVENEGTTLSKSGNYEITVADLAGNTNTYQFTIQVYFNTNSIVLFIIIFIGVAALVFYIYKSRKNLKVR